MGHDTRIVHVEHPECWTSKDDAERAIALARTLGIRFSTWWIPEATFDALFGPAAIRATIGGCEFLRVPDPRGSEV